jgi:integrase
LVQRDLNAAWAAIATATVDDQARTTAWHNWSTYARECGIDPWLRYHSKSSKQTYFLAFAARVRSGIFGNAVQVGHQTVEKAIRHVAQTLMLAGYDDPRRTYGAKELDLPFRHLLRSYKTQDPAPKPQLAIPVATIERAAEYHQAPNSLLTRATADLITIAFFFLLRVGEYTMPKRNIRTRTIQFRVQDVTFRQADGTVIPNSAPLHDLLVADSVTLWMDNQKNGQRGATIHHTRCPGWFCPVKALARRIHSILSQGCPLDTPLSFVSPALHVAAPNITALVHQAARDTNLASQGYDLKRVSTHSLRASGAMALKLQGVDDSLIMKIGRWTGLTFLTYIHSQIGALNTGLAQRMATRVHFVNVAG